MINFPNIDEIYLHMPRSSGLGIAPTHKPRILLLYGSLRERSYSKLLILEAVRLLQLFGCETRVYDPAGLPLPDAVDADHPKVADLRALSLWSEGQVWCSPERHGALTGIMKAQIDWLPLEQRGVRPTQGVRWQSCKCPGKASRSTRSTGCACSGGGCG